MELHQLQILRELGALGSVTAVAEALRVTPSAVSQQLAALQRGVRTPVIGFVSTTPLGSACR